MPLVCFPPQDLKKYGSTVLVRCCEPSYKTEALTDEGIKVVVRMEGRKGGGCDRLSWSSLFLQHSCIFYC